LPTPVSAFDVYRFAHFYDMTGLLSLALEDMKRNFMVASIVDELFEETVGQYPDVEQAMVDFVMVHWDDVQRSSAYARVIRSLMGTTAGCHGTLAPNLSSAFSVRLTWFLSFLIETKVMGRLLLLRPSPVLGVKKKSAKVKTPRQIAEEGQAAAVET